MRRVVTRRWCVDTTLVTMVPLYGACARHIPLVSAVMWPVLVLLSCHVLSGRMACLIHAGLEPAPFVFQCSMHWSECDVSRLCLQEYDCLTNKIHELQLKEQELQEQLSNERGSPTPHPPPPPGPPAGGAAGPAGIVGGVSAGELPGGGAGGTGPHTPSHSAAGPVAPPGVATAIPEPFTCITSQAAQVTWLVFTRNQNVFQDVTRCGFASLQRTMGWTIGCGLLSSREDFNQFVTWISWARICQRTTWGRVRDFPGRLRRRSFHESNKPTC